MAVFRIEKTRDYTVMSNYHLRDRSLSLKAKGLLSLMLSLPEDWDYTMKGLARICKDGIDSYEPLFLLCHIEFHLDVPLSVCHGQPPFLIRVWDGLACRLGRRFKAFHALRSPPETSAPTSNFEFSGKGPENFKIRKRVLACCAC